MIKGQLKLLEDALNEEKLKRHNDLQKILSKTPPEKEENKDAEWKKLFEEHHAKLTKHQAEIEAIKARLKDLENTETSESNYADDHRFSDNFQNDQNGLDTLRTRIEKVAYEMAKLKNHLKQEKSTSVKNMNQLTSWIKKVMSGVQLELEAQEKNLVNLTETVQQKDKQILGLESQIKTALSENEKLRKTLYESDMDRELRLARLELALEGSLGQKNSHHKAKKIKDEDGIH